MAIKANKSTKKPKSVKGKSTHHKAMLGARGSKPPVKFSSGAAAKDKKKGGKPNPFAKNAKSNGKDGDKKDAKNLNPKDRFKAMLDAKKKKGKTQKASITAKKPKLATGRKTKLSSGAAKKKDVKMTSGKKYLKASITAKKAKVVKHKRKGRV